MCVACKKPESALSNTLKRCAQCQTTTYCSRECQRADWKSHKKICIINKVTGSSSSSTASKSATERLEDIFKLFTLSGGTSDTKTIFNSPGEPGFLSRLSEHDAFAAIVDSYRLRVEDEYNFRGDAGGLYAGENPLPDFRGFLNKVEKCNDILPPWWNKEKRKACVQQALRSSEWSNINSAVEKSDIIEHYNDTLMPMRLRMIAERVTGSKVGGF